jgi:phosphate transport system substrate-binding protein
MTLKDRFLPNSIERSVESFAAVRRRSPILLRKAFGAMIVIGMSFCSASAETLIVQGSSTFYQQLMEVYQSAIEAKAGHKLTVTSNKSSLGLFSLFERRADIAMISASLDSEIAALRNTNPALPFEQLQNFEISRTRIAFAVHPSNSIRAASLDKIRQVLRGEINNWQQLGGSNTPIRLVVVRGGGGVTAVVENALLQGRPIAASGVIYVQSGSQVIQVVARESGAMGLAQLALTRQENLPELVTDQVVEQQLNLVTLGEPTPAMRAVIDAVRTIAISNKH